MLGRVLFGLAAIEATDKAGRTMLLHATSDGEWEAADVLLAHVASLAATDRQGYGAADLLRAARDRIEGDGRPVPPGLLSLEARLRRSDGGSTPGPPA